MTVAPKHARPVLYHVPQVPPAYMAATKKAPPMMLPMVAGAKLHPTMVRRDMPLPSILASASSNCEGGRAPYGTAQYDRAVT